MKFRKQFISMMVVVSAILFAIPAFAQGQGSYTLTEADINDSFRINNPARVRISNIGVDLVPGAAEVTATYNYRGGSADVTSTAIPSVEGGRITWDVTSVQVAGDPISDSLLQQINNSVDSAWRNYARGQYEGRFTDVIVTENDITFYFGASTEAEVAEPVEGESAPTEEPVAEPTDGDSAPTEEPMAEPTNGDDGVDAARGSYTLTEADINDSFRINNPARVRVSNVSVNLVPGAAQVTATYNYRGGSADVTSTSVPSVEGGRITWNVTSVQVAGDTISDSLLQQINNSVDSAWRNYARGQYEGRFTDVIVTENDITFYFGSI